MNLFTFTYECLHCHKIVSENNVKFIKSKAYARSKSQHNSIQQKDMIEISECPHCHIKKGFNVINTKNKRDVTYLPKSSFNMIDLFCGCGGLSEGFQNQGFHSICGVDVNKPMIQSYIYNHPSSKAIVGDINAITADDILYETNYDKHDVHLIVGGPPCQGFSTVGDQKKNDPRNILFYQFHRIVQEINPPFFIMENVPTILTTEDGLVKEKIIDAFEKIGYHVVTQILKAVEYGVPQNRKRAFFFGTRIDMNPSKMIPKEKRNQNTYVTVKDAIFDLPDLQHGEGTFQSNYTYPAQNTYQILMRAHSKFVYNHISSKHSQLVLQRIQSLHEGENHKHLPKELQLKRGYSNIYGKLWSDRPADTITGNCGCVSAPGRFIHPKKIRGLTVREGARLQSFPDDFIIVGNSTSIQYKQVGNAVPPLLASALAKTLLSQMKMYDNFK